MTAANNVDFENLKAANTIVRAAPLLYQQARRTLPPVLGVLGLVGGICLVYGLTTSPGLGTQPLADALSFVTIISTLFISVVISTCYQRQLFCHLVTSFNFMFISWQISMALICLCDAFHWQSSKILFFASTWVWLHLALTMDSLSPVMKSQLRVKVWYAAPVIALALAGQIALIAELTWHNNWNLQNRVLWRVSWAGSRQVVIGSSSLLLGRLVTLVVWFVRILVRIARRRSDDELALVQGMVEFDYVSWKRSRAASTCR